MPLNPDPRRLDGILSEPVTRSVQRKAVRGLKESYSAGGHFGALKTGYQHIDTADGFASARFPALIAQVDDVTKSVVQDIVAKGIAEGAHPDVIASRLESKFDDWTSPAPGKQSRAERIARTETAEAFNEGTVNSYDQAGVRKVKVYDGDFDDACVAANGQEWTLSDARGRLIEHPNCVRAFGPVVDGA